MLLYRRQKMRQAIQRGIPRKADAAKTGSFTKSPGKEAQSVIAIIRLNQGENFSRNKSLVMLLNNRMHILAHSNCYNRPQ